MRRTGAGRRMRYNRRISVFDITFAIERVERDSARNDARSEQERQHGGRFGHLTWDTTLYERNLSIRSPQFGTPESRLPEQCRAVKYPLRTLRYWFMYHLVQNEACRRQRPLDICEIGVDVGQMLLFMDARPGADGARGLPEAASRWDAVDCDIRADILYRCGYTKLIEADLEAPCWDLAVGRYDVIVLLHVLEHLQRGCPNVSGKLGGGTSVYYAALTRFPSCLLCAVAAFSRSRAAESIQRSLWPERRRNFSSAASRLAATQRRTILPPSHSVTRRVRARIPALGLSMMLVETRLRRREEGTPRRFTVNISAMPSRMLPAALG